MSMSGSNPTEPNQKPQKKILAGGGGSERVCLKNIIPHGDLLNVGSAVPMGVSGAMPQLHLPLSAAFLCPCPTTASQRHWPLLPAWYRQRWTHLSQVVCMWVIVGRRDKGTLGPVSLFLALFVFPAHSSFHISSKHQARGRSSVWGTRAVPGLQQGDNGEEWRPPGPGLSSSHCPVHL